MLQAIILSTPRFILYSFGNGLAYDLTRRDGLGNVFVQGDDASTFRDELDAMESAAPDRATDEILGELFATYAA